MPGWAARQSPAPGVTTRFPLLIPILDQHYAAQQIVNAVETNKVMLYMPAQGPRKGMAREESLMLSWQAWFVAFFSPSSVNRPKLTLLFFLFPGTGFLPSK